MKKGDCYPAAARLILADHEGDLTLVHGTVTGQPGTPVAGVRYGHAWVEVERDGAWWVLDHSNGKELEIPRGLYYALGQIDPDAVTRYSADEAIDQLAENQHYGPWSDRNLSKTHG